MGGLCFGNSTPSVCIERDTAFQRKYPALDHIGREFFTQPLVTKTFCTLVLPLCPACTIDPSLARSNTDTTDGTHDIQCVSLVGLCVS
jgi:hypothetical protein